MKRFLESTIIFLFLSFTAFSEDLILEYLEGFVERSTVSGWEEIFIGDELAVDSTVRVTENGFAEFSLGALTISISEDGTYLLSDLVGASKQVASWDLGSLVSRKIKTALASGESGHTAVMGVRGAAAGGSKEIEWLEAGENQELLEEGIRLLETESYDEALDLFMEGSAISFGEEEQQFLYYVSYTQAIGGNLALALSTIDKVEVNPQSSYYVDLILLKGRLLIESLAFEEALKIFNKHLRSYPEGDLSQAVLILSSFCYRGIANINQAAKSLQRAIDLNPDSELGREAGRLIQEL